MTAQSRVYTNTQKQHAELLLTRAPFWTRGTRKRDGLAFVIFPSTQATAERPRAYYSTETACSCPSYQYRGRCAHELAVRTDNERARAEAVAHFEAALAAQTAASERYGLGEAY